jgi:putative membrane protein
MKIFIRWAALSVAVWVATAILPGITVKGGAWSYLWVALLVALVNTFIGTLVKILTLPAVLLSLGLFLIVINAAMLKLVDRWSTAISINSWWSAIFASLIISIVSAILNKTIVNREK